MIYSITKYAHSRVVRLQLKSNLLFVRPTVFSKFTVSVTITGCLETTEERCYCCHVNVLCVCVVCDISGESFDLL